MKRSHFAACAILLGHLGLSALPAAAQESKVSVQAIRCAAVFSVLAESHAEDNNLANTFQEAAAMFAGVYLKENGMAVDGDDASEAARRRDLVLQELQTRYPEREALVLEETILCGSWAEGFRVQGERYAFVPIIPKIIPQKTRDDYAGYARQAFKRRAK